MLESFFAKHPIFSTQEFAAAFPDANPLTSRNSLLYHVKRGHLGRIRRGLYYVIPPGKDSRTYPVDPFLIAGRLTNDAVLSYHTALALHGLAYSIRNEFTYFTAQKQSRPLSFQNSSFKAIDYPKQLVSAGQERFSIVEQNLQGHAIYVTSIERTLVDCLDRIDICGGIEEVWRSIESISYLKVDVVVEYALVLNNATTTAKVGYFLSENQKQLMVTEEDLEQLQDKIPTKPHYMERRTRHGGIYIRDWNLMVPPLVAYKEWEEPAR